MNTAKRITLAAVGAGAVTAIAWMTIRAVTAFVFLITPLTDAAVTESGMTAADDALSSSLPLFLLENGSVAISDSSGYVAIWDAFHTHFAGLWSAAAVLAVCLSTITVLIAVLLMCAHLIRGVPFTHSLTRWVGVAGLALVFGSALAHLFTWLSRQEMLAAVEATVAANGWRLPSSAIDVDLVPAACGAVLLIVAIAFSAGQRLQRDTEGLV